MLLKSAGSKEADDQLQPSGVYIAKQAIHKGEVMESLCVLCWHPHATCLAHDTVPIQDPLQIGPYDLRIT